VLREGEYEFTAASQTGGLARITVSDPNALPNLRESYLWAHGQLVGDKASNESLNSIFTSTPQRLSSRIICPRLLDPDTRYTAFLVPVTDVGCAAGLGTSATPPPADAGMGSTGTSTGHDPASKFAWDTPNTVSSSVGPLPVYYSFSFTTADAGDFYSLALRLSAEVLNAVGSRPLAVDDPRNLNTWGAPPTRKLPPVTSGNAALHLEGALSPPPPEPPPPREPPPRPTPDEWTDSDRQKFQQALASVLNVSQPATDDPASSDPIVVPPIYGRYHAARTMLLREGRDG
jgi:hypothetical protein